MKKSKQRAPFFGLQDRMPVVLALLLGFQHALAMLAGISKSTSPIKFKTERSLFSSHASNHHRFFSKLQRINHSISGLYLVDRLRHSLRSPGH